MSHHSNFKKFKKFTQNTRELSKSDLKIDNTLQEGQSN